MIERKVYVVLRDGNHKSYDIPIAKSKEEETKDEFLHSYYLKKFAAENNINVDENEKLSYPLAENLSNEGYCPIIVENRVMCIFLPEKVSEDQYMWFKKIYKLLTRYSISYTHIENGEIIIESPDIEEGETTLLKQFDKYIKKNYKKYKESDQDGYRKIN